MVFSVIDNHFFIEQKPRPFFLFLDFRPDEATHVIFCVFASISDFKGGGSALLARDAILTIYTVEKCWLYCLQCRKKTKKWKKLYVKLFEVAQQSFGTRLIGEEEFAEFFQIFFGTNEQRIIISIINGPLMGSFWPRNEGD